MRPDKKSMLQAIEFIHYEVITGQEQMKPS